MSLLRQASQRDSVVLTRIAARSIHNGPSEEIAEDDRVVLLAKGKATSHTGKPYNNSYCIVARVAGGKFKEMTDHIDTALINDALGT